jgi:type III pantothenate kinase
MIKLMTDAGNRYTKLAVFQGKSILNWTSVKNEELSRIFISEWIKRGEKPEFVFISSVSASENQLRGFFDSDTCQVLTREDINTYPLEIRYDTPLTLGFDRIAAACGAYSLYGGSPLLVIDAGTSMTVDFVSENGMYSGGAISPGLDMRFRALHEFTGRLPLGTPDTTGSITGTSTMGSINAGAYMGMVMELQGFINRYELTYKNLKIIMTGGDTEMLQMQLKKTIFAEPNLVLIGLNEILDNQIAHR